MNISNIQISICPSVPQSPVAHSCTISQNDLPFETFHRFINFQLTHKQQSGTGSPTITHRPMSLNDRLLATSIGYETSTYNPYANPPSIEKAQQHGKATKIGLNLEGDTEESLKECPCCGNTVNKKELELTCGEDQLLFLGVGYPLYFKLFKYFGAIILIVFIVSGSGFYLLTTLNCSTNCVYFLQVPILNLDKNRKTSLLFDFTHLFTSILILLLTLFVKIRIEKDVHSLESSTISTQQYTIIVQNLPEDVQQDQIIQWSKQKFGIKPLIVNFAYNISQLQDAFAQRSALTIRMNRMIVKKNQMQVQKQENMMNLMTEFIKDMQQKINKYDLIIDHYRHQNINCRKIGTVFLTYPQQKNVLQILNKYQTSFLSTIMNNSLSSFRKKSVQYNKIPVVIRKAPAPRQIIWENLTFSYVRYVVTQLLALITMMMVLFVAFRVQLRFAEMEYQVRQEGDPEGLDDVILNFIESFSLSVMIMLINLLLRFIIQTFINIKKHYSYSRYESSFCFYYSLMYIFNTCFMIYIIHMRHRPITPQTQDKPHQLPTTQRDRILLYDIHILMLINAWSDPVYKLVDPFMWVRVVRRRYIAGLPAQANPYTQAYVNQLWEESTISNVDNYQYIFRVLVVTVWFAHAAPLGVLISLLGFVADYWVSKYVMLKWSKKPETISKRIAVPMIKSLPLIPLAYLCGVLQYVYKVSDSNNLFGFVLDFLSYAAVILITIVIIIAYYYLQPPPKVEADPAPYDEVQVNFDSNYETENPMNKIKADLKYASYRDLKRETLKSSSKIFDEYISLNRKQSISSDKQQQISKLKKRKLMKLKSINVEILDKQGKAKNQGSYQEKSSSDSSVED